jgi:hypothetical protein
MSVPGISAHISRLRFLHKGTAAEWKTSSVFHSAAVRHAAECLGGLGLLSDSVAETLAPSAP